MTLPASVAIKGRWVVCMKEGDEENGTKVLDRHAVLIDTDGKIEKIIPNDQVDDKAYTVVDKSENHVLMPGMINCHTHMGMTILRGYADDKPLDEWLQKYIWPAEGNFMSEEYVKLGAELAAYEMLQTGTTCANEMYYLPEVVSDVTQKAKLRCHLCQPVIDLGNGEVGSMVDRSLHWTKEQKAKHNPFVSPVICAHAVYTVPEEQLNRIGKANNSKEDGGDAEGLQATFHVHLHETRREVEDYAAKHQKSAIDVLDTCKLLNERCIAAHCVWLTKEEIALLAERKVNVCHNPRSNMKLASGIAPISALLKAGVNVCLGTDSTCSNNSLNMLGEVQFAALLAKVHTHDAATLDDYTALKLATINGAKALGKEKELGSLESGKWGDVVAVDLSDEALLPVYCPISHLVYTSERRVTDVWVAGEQVVDGCKVLTLEIEKGKVQAMAEKIKEFKSNIEATKAEAVTANA